MAAVDLGEKEILLLIHHWEAQLKKAKQVKRITLCASRIEALRETLREELNKPPNLRVVNKTW